MAYSPSPRAPRRVSPSRDKRFGFNARPTRSAGSSPRPFAKNGATSAPRRVGASAPYKGASAGAGKERPRAGASLAFSRAPFVARPKPASAPFRARPSTSSRPSYVGAKTTPYVRKTSSAPYRGRTTAPSAAPYRKTAASAPYKGKAPFVRKPFERSGTPVKPRTASASWGGVAGWYDKHLEGADTYHEKVLLPNVLRLVDPKKGEQILDLACGQGYFTRALTNNGASVTGIDLSSELIELAKTHAPTATFRTGDAGDLSQFPDSHFDKVLIVLAIQNIEQTRTMYAEVARVLKPQGTFHIVMNHPAFRIPKRSGWAYDEKGGIQYRRIDQYISESREAIDMHPGMKNSPQTLSFHRPLQYYFKGFIKSGFAVDRFEEWTSHKASDSGPRAQAENVARKEIPLFLYMRAQKI